MAQRAAEWSFGTSRKANQSTGPQGFAAEPGALWHVTVLLWRNQSPFVAWHQLIRQPDPETLGNQATGAHRPPRSSDPLSHKVS